MTTPTEVTTPIKATPTKKRSRSEVFFRQTVPYCAGRLVLALSNIFPRGMMLKVGRFLGGLAYYLSAERRRVARINLDLAYGDEKSDDEKRRISREAFRNLGEVATEFLYFNRATAEQIARTVEVDPAGLERLRAALAKGKGVLAPISHFGNFELLALAVGFLGEAPLNLVVKRIKNPGIEAIVSRYRLRSGNRAIYQDEAMSAILGALRRGEIVGLVCDQNSKPGNGGAFVDFFGVPAGTSRSIAAYALATGAPVIPMTCHTLPGGRYRIRFRPEVEVERTGALKRDQHRLLEACCADMEAYIREEPERWFWFHRRWKARPQGEPPIYPIPKRKRKRKLREARARQTEQT